VNQEAAELWGRALQAFHTAMQIVESDPDAAAGRAYYAAFYAVSAYFALQGQTFSRHSALEIAISRDLVKAGQWPAELGKTYSFLLELRSTGDYGGALHVSREDATKAMTGTRQILEAVSKSNPGQFSLLPSRS
jgi:uncharacterized protein